jgi:hypothetical protein
MPNGAALCNSGGAIPSISLNAVPGMAFYAVFRRRILKIGLATAAIAGQHERHAFFDRSESADSADILETDIDHGAPGRIAILGPADRNLDEKCARQGRHNGKS